MPSAGNMKNPGMANTCCLCDHKKVSDYNDTQAGIRHVPAGHFKEKLL
jgi:hypothetical protein